MRPVINIYADGSRQGKAPHYYSGWGVILEAPGQRKEFEGGAKGASNNQMEIKAVTEGLRNIKVTGADIKIFSDSAYVVNCFREKWYEGWQQNGWMTSMKKPVENRVMWQELLSMVKVHHSVIFFHVDGHIKLQRPEEVAMYHKKFNEKNNTTFSLEEFIHVVENNIAVDKLATKGAADIRKLIEGW